MTKSLSASSRALLPVLGVLLVGGACASPADLGSATTSTQDQAEAPPSSSAIENGGDGLVGWSAPAGSEVRLAVDDERNDAIELAGGGEYRFPKGYQAAEKDDERFKLSWDMRFGESWTVEVDVTTDHGTRTLRYQPVDVDRLGEGVELEYGVGSWMSDDRWHSISRDLSSDLRDAQPNATLVSVNRIRVRGSGRVDSIRLETSFVNVPDPANFETISSTSGMIATGLAHSCVMLSGGVKCFGANNAGQLGNNATTNAAFSVQVSGITTGATHVSAYGDRTCAVVGGSAKCWGAGSAKIPTQVTGLTTGVTAIAPGNAHTCALVSGGVKCWTPTATTPTAVSGLTSGVTAIAAGRDFTCALNTAGAVKCWGTNTYGQLGNNTLTNSTVPVQVSGLTSGVLGIAAGESHVCARISTGVRCWGLNAYGQLGNNTITNSRVPVVVSGLGATTHLTGGRSFTCAIASNGAVKCWGANSYGQLGDNTSVAKRVPVQVYTLTGGATSVSAGALHACARVNSTTRCWGYGVYGQLGNGFYTNRVAPVETAMPFSALGQITQPGNYVLTTNLTTGNTPAIFIHDTSNVTLNCNGRTLATSSFTQEMIKVDNVTNVTVENCNSVLTFGSSIFATRVNGGTIRKNAFSMSDIQTSKNVRFTQNTVYGGVQHRTGSGALIDANTFIGPTTGIIAGMVILDHGSSNRVLNNTMDGKWSGNPADFLVNGSDDGVIMQDEVGCQITGNTITNNWDASIESVGSLTNCTISNNKLSNNLITAIGGWYWNSWRGNKVIGNTASKTNSLLALYRHFALRTAGEVMYFQDNTFTNNVETLNAGGMTFIDMSFDRASTQENGIPITAATWIVGNNHFGGNTFGGPTPLLWPQTAMVDDGANVCAKGWDSTYPLLCGRP